MWSQSGLMTTRTMSERGADTPEVTTPVAEINAQLLVHKAVWFRDLHSLKQYCRKGKDVLNTLDRHGNTPLSLAHRLGYDDVVHFLLERGVDPRIPTGRGDGRAVSDWVCRHDHVSCTHG